jgi:hypothetical protein
MQDIDLQSFDLLNDFDSTFDGSSRHSTPQRSKPATPNAPSSISSSPLPTMIENTLAKTLQRPPTKELVQIQSIKRPIAQQQNLPSPVDGPVAKDMMDSW